MTAFMSSFFFYFFLAGGDLACCEHKGQLDFVGLSSWLLDPSFWTESRVYLVEAGVEGRVRSLRIGSGGCWMEDLRGGRVLRMVDRWFTLCLNDGSEA